MKNFDGLGLHDVLVQSLKRMKYDTPTPIQAQGIPLALQGRDVMGSAQTGTGKTAAFAIPLIQKLLTSQDGGAIILTPTRELAKQIMDVVHQMLGPKSGINTAYLIGGEPMGKQFAQLKRNPRIVVGTPGRINDHLNRRSLNLSNTSFLVLDETDRMLDMGFSIQIDEIVKHLPKERQTLMFSATLPDNIVRLSKNYLNNPERISVGSTVNPIKNIRQEVIRVTQEGKYEVLATELHARSGTIIIFVKTKFSTEKLAKRLSQEGFDAQAIHGDLRQRRRDRVIQDLRNKKFRILVATDVIARGLDIPHIEHVINYDLPQVPEDYIHRIGRTARAGADGDALCLISPQDGRKWYAIEQLMNPNKKPEFKTERKPNKFKSRSGGGNKGGFGGNSRRKPEGQHWKKSEGDSQGKSWNKSGDSAQKKPWKKSEGNSQGKSWNKSGDSAQKKSWDKSGEGVQKKSWNKSEGSSQGKSWDKPRNNSSEEGSERKFKAKPRKSFEGKPRGKFENKFKGNTGDQPRTRSNGQSGDQPRTRSEGNSSSGDYFDSKPKNNSAKPQHRKGGNPNSYVKSRSSAPQGGKPSFNKGKPKRNVA